MSETDSSPSWAPRAGWKFFLLWLAGAAVIHLLSTALILTSRPFSLGWHAGDSVLPVLLALADSGWQAWLIFRRGWRLVAWVGWTVLLVGVSIACTRLMLASPMKPVPLVLTVFYFQPFASALMTTLLLVGARRRPWAWLLAGVAVALLNAQGGFMWLFPSIESLFSELQILSSLLGPGRIMMAFYAGQTLIFAAVSAGVLAWLMPPVARKDRAVSPPQPAGS